ncbi:PRC-barrel domain-containing protein [Arthrobacter crystallopoietes BAB-32]|uniref:PRC-barrel domain-containing protein n=1 Tax=Arthrobacter crystallopoietes BAB-32 TaxID=1246476 RepID=N1V025_9MICC|nr:PRC-barrel domain-containing protein [Arthrobacter crystallopoietes]EMY33427.1 PRC-barrel domain-containing protein [Arthrobacter crystallopoietes BAB-32]
MDNSNQTATLVKLGETGRTIALGDEDIRGRDVKSRSGEDIGKVEDLLIDPGDDKVRFLIVASGGFLGLGKDKAFIPVDAVTAVGGEEVTVDQSREHIAGAPAYDPDLISQREYQEEVYGHYNYTPYWAAGYMYPGYPYFR